MKRTSADRPLGATSRHWSLEAKDDLSTVRVTVHKDSSQLFIRQGGPRRGLTTVLNVTSMVVDVPLGRPVRTSAHRSAGAFGAAAAELLKATLPLSAV